MKVNKIKCGIYKGVYWRDFVSPHKAKSIAHKQERVRAKKIIATYM